MSSGNIPNLSQRITANKVGEPDSCLNRLPNVQCMVDLDCQKWQAQNCSLSDQAIMRSICDRKEGKYDLGVCSFLGIEKNSGIIFGGN